MRQPSPAAAPSLLPVPPVVVGIDDSPSSLAVAATAAELARRRGLPLRLVRALPAGQEAVRAAAEDLLVAVRRSVRGVLPEDAVTSAVRAGPADLVLEHESRTAVLLVVGAADAPGGGLAPAAATLVRRAACPVLVARPEQDRSAGTGVVVGVDGGPGTAALLTAARSEAELRGGSLLVLHAWDRPGGGSLLHEAAVDAAERTLLEGYVGPLRAQRPAVAVDLQVVHAPPVQALVSAAGCAQLLVVGRRPGRRRGGTVDTVAATAAAPVLVIPVDPAHPAVPAARAGTLTTPA